MADWFDNVYYACTSHYPILTCDGRWATVDKALLQDDLVYDCATYHMYKVYKSKAHYVPSCYLMLSKIADMEFNIGISRDTVFGEAGALTYIPSVGYVYFIPHKKELEIYGPATVANYSKNSVDPEVAEAVMHGSYEDVVRLIEAKGYGIIKI